MQPLSDATPKPLLSYRGKTNLDHLFERLPDEIDEAIMLIHHLPEKIRAYCGERFHSRRISYAEDTGEGTGAALFAAREQCANERFAVAYGDEVFAGDELSRALGEEYSWLCYEVGNPHEVGIVRLGADGRIIEVVEKPKNPPSNLAADGFMVIDSDIFSCRPTRHQDGEFYLSDLMNQFVKTHAVKAVLASRGHTQLTRPEDIERLDIAPFV